MTRLLAPDDPTPSCTGAGVPEKLACFPRPLRDDTYFLLCRLRPASNLDGRVWSSWREPPPLSLKRLVLLDLFPPGHCPVKAGLTELALPRKSSAANSPMSKESPGPTPAHVLTVAGDSVMSYKNSSGSGGADSLSGNCSRWSGTFLLKGGLRAFLCRFRHHFYLVVSKAPKPNYLFPLWR